MKKILSIALVLVFCGSLAGSAAPSLNENMALFKKAQRHMEKPESTDVRSLVTLTKSDKSVFWNKAGDKVLMVNFTKDASDYKIGDSDLVSKNIWCFSQKEVADWYALNKNAMGPDPRMRIRKLTGLSPKAEEDTFVLFWVDPKVVLRPANQTNVFVDAMEIHSQAYKDATARGSEHDMFNIKQINLEKKIRHSSDRVATHLGYTYDWGRPGHQYGLSEFMIPPFNKADIVAIVPFATYFKNIEQYK